MHNVTATLIIALACASAAPADTRKPFKEPAAGTVFPPALGKWARGADRNYGRGLGTSISYNSETGTIATAHVYNRDIKFQPTASPEAGCHVNKTGPPVIRMNSTKLRATRQGSTVRAACPSVEACCPR